MGLIGILVGLALLVWLAYRGWSVLLLAPVAALIAAAFAGLYAELPHSLVEISDREVAITLDGPQAATLLSVACPVDVESFAVGTGARTVLDGVQVVLYRDAPDRFTLEVWRSFLPHVLGLLEIGNRELATGL